MEIRHDRGFTLIESLIVLSIFMIIVSATIFMIKPQENLLNRNLFFSQLKADYFYAQAYAIAHQNQLSFNILPSQNKYYIKKQDGTYIIERYYAKNILIREGTLSLNFTININGNVNKFGTIMIYIGKESYILTIYIGKGRFYVMKG